MDTKVLALIISGISLLIAIFSPIFTAFLNGRYMIKSKNLDLQKSKEEREYEFLLKHRAEVIENYLKAAGDVITSYTTEAFSRYGLSYAEIYLYLDESKWELIDSIDTSINENNYENAAIFLRDLVKRLSKENIRKI
ncbi:MAG: hypothetical protein IJT79_08485 [Ruminococcus sp.]|nr:hypothetical protein [Ruminococcus sp.]